MHDLLYIAVGQPPRVTQTPVLLYVFGAFLGGGGIAAFIGLVRYWRRGQVEDTELISRITKDTMQGAKDILAEYRLEVEIVKRQVENYREQLNRLTIALAEANIRIQNLESELSSTKSAHGKLMDDLQDAVRERKRLISEIERLHADIKRLLRGESDEVNINS